MITGATGFIGSHLTGALQAQGHQVFADRTRVGQPVDSAPYRDARTFIHAAHDFTPGSEARNLQGAKQFLEAASHCHRIFISSHSARPDAQGGYGLTKYRIEEIWRAAGGAIVRPGLVLGPGGLFGRNVKAILNSRIIPLVDGGRDPVAVIGIQDLCAAMVRLTESGAKGEWNLFNERHPSMREIVRTVLRLSHKQALIVPVPFTLAMASVRTAEALNLKLPFTSTSLVAMKLNRTPVHRSGLRELLERETDLEAAVTLALF